MPINPLDESIDIDENFPVDSLNGRGQPIARFDPRIVKMAPAGEKPED